MRQVQFAENEFYHVYNRGVDKRAITLDAHDSNRFVQSLVAFNTTAPIGSIYQQSFQKDTQLSNPVAKLVSIVSFCLNPNHYHLLLTPLVDDGVQKFMQRLGTGYTQYFNKRHERSGVLFQGKFKARHIKSDADLRKISAYVNLNDRVHQLSNPVAKLVRSSWDEYVREGEKGSTNGICDKDVILGQFQSPKAYATFAEKMAREIARERAEVDKAEEEAIKKEFYAEYFD